MEWYQIFLVTLLGYALTLLLIVWVLLTKSRHPVSAVAWIMLIIVVPIGGGLLYLIFGLNHVERRVAGKLLATSKIGRILPDLSPFFLMPSESRHQLHVSLMRLLYRLEGTLPTYGNHLRVICETDRTFELIREAIQNAKAFIHLEYYIWRPDELGTSLRNLLIEKAGQGVKIRFLYDSFGSLSLSNQFLAPMKEAGIEVASFLPGRTFRERWSINLRNHRKIIIADGLVAFTGGMNVGDEYVGKNSRFGTWRDTHLQVEGPAVAGLHQIFLQDWYYATNDILTDPVLFPVPEVSGKHSLHVIAGGPSRHSQTFHDLMFTAINSAQTKIAVTTSFFVPPEPLLMALENAARRGIHVRLLVAGRVDFWSAHRWTIPAGRASYQSLLKAGVEIFEYQSGLLHAKTLTIDGTWSLIGTPNFDSRSLLLNFEAALAIYDSQVAVELEEQFESDTHHAIQIESQTWANRGTTQKIWENFCRLFTPVL